MLFRSRLALIAIIPSIVSVSSIPALADDIQGVPSVIDGDTLEIRGQRIRLFGIDAPEGRQMCQRDGEPWRCGQNAAFKLADIIGRNFIRCEEQDRDRYKRIVAICYLGADKDIGAAMVREGWALDYRQYSKGRYDAAEIEARQGKRGIWAGSFVKPWEWRRGKR